MLIDLTSEEFLLSCSEFDAKTLGSLSELIVRSLQQVTSPYSVIEIILFRVVVRLCVSYPLEWLFFLCWFAKPNTILLLYRDLGPAMLRRLKKVFQST